jgi:hypothetical protein
MITTTLLLFAAALFPAAATLAAGRNHEAAPSSTVLAHVSNSFQLTVNAPIEKAGLLFGPDGERNWAGKNWHPVFLHPQPGRDVQGAVFTVPHGDRTAVWVNTLFDVANGQMQYVCFVPDMLVFSVDVHLTALHPTMTKVVVTYVRTALKASANETVEVMGRHDRDAGGEWQRSIDAYLNKDHKDTTSGGGSGGTR